MSHIFISYSTKDRPFVNRVADFLLGQGFRIWLDEHSIPASGRWLQEIEKAIRDSHAVLLVMSESARESQWVENELLRARQLEKPIFPILLNGEVWLPFLNTQLVKLDSRDLPDASTLRSLEETRRAFQPSVLVNTHHKPHLVFVYPPVTAVRRLAHELVGSAAAKLIFPELEVRMDEQTDTTIAPYFELGACAISDVASRTFPRETLFVLLIENNGLSPEQASLITQVSTNGQEPIFVIMDIRGTVSHHTLEDSRFQLYRKLQASFGITKPKIFTLLVQNDVLSQQDLNKIRQQLTNSIELS